MLTKFVRRIFVFFMVLAFSLLPFAYIGLTGEMVHGPGGMLAAFRKVVQSGEALIIATGIAATAAGDFMLSTYSEGPRRLRSPAMLNFFGATLFLLASSTTYGFVEMNSEMGRPFALHQMIQLSAMSILMALLIVLSTTWLNEWTSATDEEIAEVLRKFNRVLWGVGPKSSLDQP